MGDLPTLQPNSPILLQKCLKTAKSAKNVRFAVILNTNLSTYSSYMIDKIQISSIMFSEMNKTPFRSHYTLIGEEVRINHLKPSADG